VRQSRLFADPVGRRLLHEAGLDDSADTPLPTVAWAQGLCRKGCITWPGLERSQWNLTAFHVDGQDTKTGLGVAYASLDGDNLYGRYIPRDRSKK
jgi:hypothetical protein